MYYKESYIRWLSTDEHTSERLQVPEHNTDRFEKLKKGKQSIPFQLTGKAELKYLLQNSTISFKSDSPLGDGKFDKNAAPWR